MPVTERIVVDADPSVKKMLSEISESCGITMKNVVCNLIESKYKELKIREQTEISEYLLNQSLENSKD